MYSSYDHLCISVLARVLIIQPANTIVDSILLVKELHQVRLLCRASGSPRWYGLGNESVSTESSDQVYQKSVNATTQELYINSYNDSRDGGVYRCRTTVRSEKLEQSVELTTGKVNYAITILIHS